MLDLPAIMRDELDMRVIDFMSRCLESFEPIYLDKLPKACDDHGCNVTNLKCNQKGLEMLVGQRCLSRDFAAKLRSWHHSGFQAWVGGPVSSDGSEALERVSAYIVPPSFAGSRLRYDETTCEVTYQTSKGCTQSMDALEWIALVTSHIPGVYEQTVRYCGRHSNASRGKRRKLALVLAPADEVGYSLSRACPIPSRTDRS